MVEPLYEIYCILEVGDGSPKCPLYYTLRLLIEFELIYCYLDLNNLFLELPVTGEHWIAPAASLIPRRSSSPIIRFCIFDN